MASPTGSGLRAQVLTIPFDPTRQAFDTSALSALATDAIAIREHAFIVDGRPVLAVFVVGRVRTATAAAHPGDEPTGAAPSNDNSPPPSTRPDWSPDQRELFDRLKQWRRDRAQAEGVPPYVIFNNRELYAVIAAQPTCLAALRAIPGSGDAKTRRHGPALLEALGHEPARGVEPEATAEPSDVQAPTAGAEA